MIEIISWHNLPVMANDYIPDWPINDNYAFSLDRISFMQKMAMIESSEVMVLLATALRIGALTNEGVAQKLEAVAIGLDGSLRHGQTYLE